MSRTFEIFPTQRVRPSPFFEATVAEGVRAFQPYNRMLMPSGYGHPEAEYRRLIEGVSMWDVAVERQVELVGPDAARLAQIVCTRDLSKCRPGQGKYVAMCDHRGTIINDPIILKLADDRYWLSIADNNMVLWCSAIAAERGLDVKVFEPDVSPLAVQGPRAEDVVASIFGDWVRELRYFWFREARINGIPVQVARSGWSKQGGFEIYLEDGSRGTELWNIVKEAGAPYGIGPGNPNLCERIESGLLSYGGDTDDDTNPFEIRLEKYVDLEISDEAIGIKALRRIKAEGVKRHQLGLRLDGDLRLPVIPKWRDLSAGGQPIGHLTNAVWSYRLKQTIGFALVSVDAQPGDRVSVGTPEGELSGNLCELPFL